MRLIENGFANELASRIVKNFGDGNYRKDRYIFDQITKLPNNYTASRVAVSKVLASLDQTELLVILDPHPNNSASVQEVAAHFGFVNEWAYRASVAEVKDIVSYQECDFYLLNGNGDLLAVGCHEDYIDHGERLVWVPSPKA
jgi:hypothetical protein